MAIGFGAGTGRGAGGSRGGGLIQLVALGSQDQHLTGNPQVTFFKTVHRRHTNFAMETIVNTFSGTTDFGRTATCTLSRNGDLVHKVYVQVKLPKFSDSMLASYNVVQAADGSTVEYWPKYKTRADGAYWMSKERWVALGGDDGKVASDADKVIESSVGVWFQKGTFVLAGDVDGVNWSYVGQGTNQLTGANITSISGLSATGNVTMFVEGSSTSHAIATATVTAQKLTAVDNGKVWGWARKTGHALIKSVNIEIGGQMIDRHYGEWMDVWSQLSMSAEKANGYATMINEGPTDYALQAKADEEVTLYIPLQFWFCTNPGLSLPLIALQYHEVKINFDFRDVKEMVHIKHTDNDDEQWSAIGMTTEPGQLTEGTHMPRNNELECDLLVDYIYLDTEERKRFAMMTHEYLITQLQHTGVETWGNSMGRFRLNFNHPVKELVWITVPDSASTKFNEHFKYEDMMSDRSLVDKVKLQLNGHERFSERDSSYFTLVQPFQHHTNIPMDAIHVYSFALKPEDIQPSGTCNFSRIDNATLILSPSDANTGASDTGISLRVYATNYNVLRIMSGMGGLAYAN